MAVTQRHEAFDPQAVSASTHPGVRPPGFRSYREYQTQSVAFTLDLRGLAQLNEAFHRLPQAAEKALRRATKALSRWLTRRVLQAAAQASGVTQKGLVASKRGIVPAKADITIAPNGYAIRVWIGTKPIHAQYLGRARWTPYRGAGSRPKGQPRRAGKGEGARVRNHLFPGTWVWGTGSASGSKVMKRTGHKDAYTSSSNWAADYEKEGITEPLYDIVHAPVEQWMRRLEAEAARRFEVLLQQQLNYALNVENK